MPKKPRPKKPRLTLHPLRFEEALGDLLKIKPAAKPEKSRQKPKLARRKAKKTK